MNVSFTAEEISAITQPKSTRGATGESIRRLSGLADARAGDLTFLGNPKYKAEVANTSASMVLLPIDYAGEPKSGQLFLLVENPSAALARICARIEQALWPKPEPGIHPSAVIAPDVRVPSSATVGPLCVIESGATIGERVHLQAQVFVGRNSAVGDDSWVGPGVVVVTECTIGKRVRLHPGVIIGADGFGYEFVQGRHQKIPQVGTVLIGDDVEIGANTTLDRARFSQTSVGEGTKIDNLVQVGHNVVIGRHCMICAQVGISGSAMLGDYVVLGGQAGIAGHVKIGSGVKAGGKAGLNADLDPGSYVNGNPAMPFMLDRRIAVLKRRLPDLFRRVDALEEQLVDAKKTSS